MNILYIFIYFFGNWHNLTLYNNDEVPLWTFSPFNFLLYTKIRFFSLLFFSLRWFGVPIFLSSIDGKAFATFLFSFLFRCVKGFVHSILFIAFSFSFSLSMLRLILNFSFCFSFSSFCLRCWKSKVDVTNIYPSADEKKGNKRDEHL